MFVHRVEDSIFGRKIELVVSSMQEFNALLKGYGSKERVGKEWIAGMISYFAPSDANPKVTSERFCIWLSRFEPTPYFISTLVHECYHCMAKVMENLGVLEEEEGAEARAYYLDSLVKQCLTALEGRPT